MSSKASRNGKLEQRVLFAITRIFLRVQELFKGTRDYAYFSTVSVYVYSKTERVE
jgi:hypothetical protein